MKKISKGRVNNHMNVPYTISQFSMSFSSTYRLFENQLRIFGKIPQKHKNSKVYSKGSNIRGAANRRGGMGKNVSF